MLTEWHGRGTIHIAGVNHHELLSGLTDDEDSKVQRALSKLYDLEIKARGGRLIILPCKPGEIAYMVANGCDWRCCETCDQQDGCDKRGWHVEPHTTSETFWARHRAKLGDTVFLTAGEAEDEVEKQKAGED